MNQRSPLLWRQNAGRSEGPAMVELKIVLMVVMIAILFFAIYFTAIPG
jgi:hypothetical protein